MLASSPEETSPRLRDSISQAIDLGKAELKLVHDERNGAWGFNASFTNGDAQQVLFTPQGIQLNDAKTNALVWEK